MPNTNQQNPEGANAQAKSTTRHNTEREAAKKKVTRFIHIILFVTIATVVAEICILLFYEKKELKLESMMMGQVIHRRL